MVAAVAAGRTTATALVEAALAQAEAHAGLNAFMLLDTEGALDAARALDTGRGRRGPLAGVPIAVKDNIAMAGLPTTAGTAALKGWVPREDAPVLARLRAAGAIPLGKTGLHELAFGITSNNAGFGGIGNACAPDRFAGGSSGGTAAAIAAGIVAAGLGTDTGGSVRIPAALNGIAGLRPTAGRYPAAGIVPISRTRDTAGPMACRVDDLVLLDGVICGEPTNMEPAPLDGLRLGLPAPLMAGLDSETGRVTGAAFDTLRTAGVTFVPVAMPGLCELSASVGFALAMYEARTGIAAFLAEHETGLSIEALAAGIASSDVKHVFDTFILGADAVPEERYRRALDIDRPRLMALYADTFADERLDGLAFPTTPLPAQPITGSDRRVMLNGREAPTCATFIRNTEPGSNVGIPGLTIPAGLTREGLPVGLEIDMPAGADRRLLAIGLAVEAALGPWPQTAGSRKGAIATDRVGLAL